MEEFGAQWLAKDHVLSCSWVSRTRIHDAVLLLVVDRLELWRSDRLEERGRE